MKQLKKNNKRKISIILTLALILSLLPINTLEVSAKSNGYGLSNPKIKSGVTTWDCIWLGKYWKDDTNKDGVANKKDSKKPIKWRVLQVNGDNALIMSDELVDFQSYTKSINETCYPTSWTESHVRKWLNKTFYNTAFTSSEQKAIQVSDVSDYDGSIVQDKLYILSLEDVVNPKYGFSKKYGKNKTRESKATKFSLLDFSGGYNPDNNYDWWWLRTLDPDDLATAYVVDYDGTIDYDGNPTTKGHVVGCLRGIRPVMKIDLSSSVWSNAGTVTSSGKVNEISPNNMKAPTNVSAKNNNKQSATLSWKKVSSAKGYEIQYSTSNKFKSAKSKTTSKTKVTFTKLKKKKTYYFRIRAYKLNGKTKIYGKWSKTLKLMITK